MELAWLEEFSLIAVAMGNANKYNHLHLILPQVANLISLKTLSRTRYLIVLQQVNSIHTSRIQWKKRLWLLNQRLPLVFIWLESFEHQNQAISLLIFIL